MAEKYRYDSAYGKLFEWDESRQAYRFVCSNPYRLTKKKLIKEYKDQRHIELEQKANDDYDQ